MKTDKFQWGFLGYGQVARERMAPAVLKHKKSELHSVASHSHSGDKIPALKIYREYEQLIGDDEIDIVYIALPNTMHAEWTIKALNQGKHVLCEKPLAMTGSDLDRITEVSQKTGCKVMEGFMYRYSARMKTVRKYIDRGSLGDIRYVQANFFSLKSRFAGIRSEKTLGGGCLWDLGCYPVSLIVTLLGLDNKRKPLIQSLGQSAGGLDIHLAGNIGFENGSIGSFACGWISDVRDITTMIIGTKGILEVQRLFNWDEGKLRVTVASGTEEILLPAEDPFEKEIEAFIQHIETGEELLMPLAESRTTVKIMENISSSAVFL